MGIPAMEKRIADGRQEDLNMILYKITGHTGNLNPLFIMEMMGFPAGWTLTPIFETCHLTRRIKQFIMKIELKNIHYSERLSEETISFSANLYIDGFKAGVASNQGHGGPTNYYGSNAKGSQLISEAEAYCKALPPEKFTVGSTTYTVLSSLEGHIDNLLSTYLEQKDLQKFRNEINRAMQQGVVTGIPDQSYRVLRFKTPIGELLAHPDGPGVIQNVITTKIKPELQKNEQVLNTNIPEKILQASGLRPGQYVHRESQQMQWYKHTKKPGRKL